MTEPLGPEDPIPPKTGLQRVVERPNQRVIDARLAKERKRQANQPRDVSRKRSSVNPSQRPHKRVHSSSVVVSEDDGSSDGDQTRSPSPINISHPDAGGVNEENVGPQADAEEVEDEGDAENVEIPIGGSAGNAEATNLVSGSENIAPETAGNHPEGDGLGFDMFDPDEDLGGPNVSALAHGGIFLACSDYHCLSGSHVLFFLFAGPSGSASADPGRQAFPRRGSRGKFMPFHISLFSPLYLKQFFCV